MTQSKYVPMRGDIIWIDMSPQSGHEQAGRRPALVLSPEDYNRLTSLALICPITSRAKGYPFEVALPQGLAVVGVILSDQLKNVDWRSRSAEFMCKVDHAVIDATLEKVSNLLTL